jgi:hypothetical protein
LQRTPSLLLIPNASDPHEGNLLMQSRTEGRATSVRYDFHSEVIAKRAIEQIELLRNRHRVIPLP